VKHCATATGCRGCRSYPRPASQTSINQQSYLNLRLPKAALERITASCGCYKALRTMACCGHRRFWHRLFLLATSSTYRNLPLNIGTGTFIDTARRPYNVAINPNRFGFGPQPWFSRVLAEGVEKPKNSFLFPVNRHRHYPRLLFR